MRATLTVGRIALVAAMLLGAMPTAAVRSATPPEPLEPLAAPLAPEATAVARTYPGPSPCNTTLQACVSGSVHGDTVNLDAGAYTTSTLVITQAITLQGAGAASTSLQSSSGRVISISTNITRTVVISGLRIMSGTLNSGTSGGAGILSGPNALHLANAEVLSNTVTVGFVNGGGLLSVGAAFITNTLFANNVTAGYGGGAYLNVTATVAGAQFLRNTAGSAGSGDGGGAQFNGRAVVSGSLFARNTSVYDGGGAIFYGLSVAITNSQFLTNSSGNDGGGMYTRYTTTVYASQFISNAAAGAAFGYGGGAFFDGSSAVEGSRFERNWSLRDGGGAYFYGGPLEYTRVRDTQFISNAQSGASFNFMSDLDGVDFIGNTGACCGGLSSGPIAMTNTRFIANVATQGGGGGASFSGPSMLQDVTFERNVVMGPSGNGGGANFFTTTVLNRVQFTRNVILSDDAQFFGYGAGAMFFDAATVSDSGFFSNTTTHKGGGLQAEFGITLTRSTLMGNRALQGGGASLQSFGAYDVSSLLSNNLFVGNTATSTIGSQILFDMPLARARVLHNTLVGSATNPGAAISIRQSTVFITNTIILSHTRAITRSGATGSAREAFNLFHANGANLDGVIVSGGGSITATPGFVNAATGNYRIGPASPARNAGAPTIVLFDFEGDLRIQPDIGYDEYVVPPFSVFIPTALR
jgi:hypothetical protein